MRRLVTLAVLLSVVGCAGAPATLTRVSSPSEMTECERLETQSSKNMWGGLFFRPVGKKRALNKAERDAQALGATHSVIVENESSYWSGGSAIVEPYKCEE